MVLPRLRNALYRWKVRRHKRSAGSVRVLGFDKWIPEKATGRALFIYIPEVLQRTLQGEDYRFFNPDGAVVEIARAANEAGFIVDAIGINDAEFTISKPYDMLIAHAGPAYSRLGEQVGDQCAVIHYSTGCHWESFNKQSEQRYGEFARRHGHTTVAPFSRPMNVEQENYAARRADLVVCLGPKTAETYAAAARRVMHVNNSAIAGETQTPIPVTENNRRGFLYSTGYGNIQKGLDLLIEAFAHEENLHLYIDSPIENELLNVYSKELARPNIHYVEWKRKLPGGPKWVREQCAFTIYTGLNSGQSTTLVAALSQGLIPVVTAEANLNLPGLEVEITAPEIEAIRTGIRSAAALSLDTLNERVDRVKQAFHEQFSATAFRDRISHAIQCLKQNC